MRRLEEALKVPPYMRQSYRTDLLAKLQTADREKTPLHRADPQLEEGVERVLLPSWNAAARKLAAEEKADLDGLRKTLVKEGGFSKACADELMEHAAALAGGDGGCRRRWLT